MRQAMRGFDFGGGGLALHAGGADQDVEAGVAAADDVEEVADDGAGGRGDDADGARECGQRALARGVEEASALRRSLSCSKASWREPAPTGSRVSATSCIWPRCS